VFASPSLLPSGFTLDFRFYDRHYILAAYIFFTTSVLFHHYLALILSYHEYSLLDIACYISTYFLYACAHDTDFDACLWFKFIDTRVLIFTRHLAFASPLTGEFWLPWILMSRSRSLELVDSPICWPEGAAVAWITGRPSRALSFQAPCASLEFSFCKLVSVICTVHTFKSLFILVFAPIGDVIFL